MNIDPKLAPYIRLTEEKDGEERLVPLDKKLSDEDYQAILADWNHTLRAVRPLSSG